MNSTKINTNSYTTKLLKTQKFANLKKEANSKAKRSPKKRFDRRKLKRTASMALTVDPTKLTTRSFITWIDEDYLDPIEAADILKTNLKKFTGINLRLRDNGIEISKKLIELMSKQNKLCGFELNFWD
jgi:hypothetical protein